MQSIKLTPLSHRFDAPLIVHNAGGALAMLYKKLHKRKDLSDVVLRMEAADDGDTKIMIVDKQSGSREVILASHTVRGIDDDGVPHLVLNGDVLNLHDYTVALAREAGLSES